MCDIQGCESEVLARGFCRKHYLRWWKHGDPNVVKKYEQPKGTDSPSAKHGQWNHPLYGIWSHMIARCHKPNDKAYHLYGARGITVCDEWHDINNFIADMGDKPKGYSLERLDNNQGYNPENCVWANPTRQARNRRCVKLSMEKAEEIRSLPRRAANGTGDGYTRQEIADMYGVSLATIKKVLSGAYWSSGEKIVKAYKEK